MHRALDKLQKAMHQRGMAGVASHVSGAVQRRFDPAWRRRMREIAVKERADRRFDSRYQVNTWGDTPLDQLGIPHQDLARGNGLYRPISEALFQEAMSLLDVDTAAYSFIDYGSGKGKVLMMASHMPFRQIIGIEFSSVLHQAALANLRVFPAAGRRSGEIIALHGDAMEYTPPAGPLVCFLFNPFSPNVWVRVLERLHSSWKGEPRPIYIVYTNQRSVDELGNVLSECSFLEPCVQRRNVLIYRARLSTQA